MADALNMLLGQAPGSCAIVDTMSGTSTTGRASASSSGAATTAPSTAAMPGARSPSANLGTSKMFAISHDGFESVPAAWLLPSGMALSSSAGVLARRHARVCVALTVPPPPPQPSAATMCACCARCVARSMVTLGLPLRLIAREKRPREAGDASSARTAVPPELWPKTVTLEGSPPNAPCHGTAKSNTRE